MLNNAFENNEIANRKRNCRINVNDAIQTIVKERLFKKSNRNRKNILSTTVRKLLPPGGWVYYIAMVYLELTGSTWRLTAEHVMGPSRTAGQGQADEKLGKMLILNEMVNKAEIAILQ